MIRILGNDVIIACNEVKNQPLEIDLNALLLNDMTELNKQSKLGVLGSGAMGSGIAQLAATFGHRVTLFDADQSALERAKIKLKDSLKSLQEKGKLKEPPDDVFSRIIFASNANEYKECDLIIEAVVENLEVKHTVFKELEHIVKKNCILATNTSSLSVTSIAAACSNPSGIIGIHFFNPATIMPLVEIIPSLLTDEKIIKPVRSLIDSWDKKTVLAKDTPGFIVNRLARPFYGEAIRIYEEGLADFATIDRAMKEIGGFKMGPFELMDFIGNDVNYKVTETVWQQMFYDPRYKPSLTQKRLYEAKLFGKKTGKGYYDYSANAKKIEPDTSEKTGNMIFERIHAMLVNEAAEALYLKIASREDLDMAMQKGVNYPKGLLQWADEVGIEKILNTLKKLKKQYGEERYRPSILLRQMANEKIKFYQ